MHIMSDYNVKFDSKDAVPIVLANQAAELLVIIILACVGIPLGLWMFSNLNNSVHGETAVGYQRVFNACKIVQMEMYGDFDHRTCHRRANARYPKYEY